jgi:hypothetical protein
MKSNISITRALAIATAIIVPVGSILTRSIVEMPAWQHLGPVAWAAFSRQADLGNGEIFYPFFGIGSFVLAVGTAFSYRFDRAASRSAAIPIYLTAVFAIGVILATTQAAPQMLSLKHAGTDAGSVQQVFSIFARWQAIRTACIALGFLCSFWAVLATSQPGVEQRTGLK